MVKTNILGVDIGGANLKAAHSNGVCRTSAFPLWKHPEQLANALRELFASMPKYDQLAVTMTGELCDCFESKRAGVHAILDAVFSADNEPISFWTTKGRFVSIIEARREPLSVAAANWLALATYVCRWTENEPALLIDVGSTTTDIIPLHGGKPTPNGRTDPERLRSGELVYTGVRRTPLCALLGPDGVAAEFFATIHDVYLLRGEIPEDRGDRDTADGRPATKQAAERRISRMLCGDEETCLRATVYRLAKAAHDRQMMMLQTAMDKVVAAMPAPPKKLIVSGSGEFLAMELLRKQSFPVENVISFTTKLGIEQSRAACAVAVSRLAD